jgi:high-affinity Fe2+/Pb2+ permease
LTSGGRPFILYESMWGYAEGNKTIVAVVVVVVAIAAIAFIARKLWQRRR